MTERKIFRLSGTPAVFVLTKCESSLYLDNPPMIKRLVETLEFNATDFAHGNGTKLYIGNNKKSFLFTNNALSEAHMALGSDGLFLDENDLTDQEFIKEVEMEAA